MKDIGMEYQAINACPDEDILYYKEHVSKYKGLKCEESRYWVEKVTKKVPCKVLCCIPVIPSLRQFFKCKSIARLMDYHAKNKSEYGVLQIPADGYRFMKI